MEIKNIKQTNGITLIALVITIIVLLILAGVAISMLSGKNGILNRATDAKKRTEESNEFEKIKLAEMAAMTNESTQEPEILENDIWSMALVNPDGDDIVHHYKWIKLKSKYKKVSLKEYKEQYLFDKLTNESESYSNMNFDDFLIYEGKASRNTWSINRRSFRIS